MANESIELGLGEKGRLVESLWHAVDSTTSLEQVPGLVRRVLETDAWRKRIYKGRTFEHECFLNFITSMPLAGCGWSPDKVEALIKDDAETLTLWHKAVTGKHGGDRKSKNDNVSLAPRQGNSKAYTLARLEKQEPELYRQVVEKKLSANAAAIKAGFRKKLTPFERIQKLIPKLSAKEKRQLRSLLE